MGDKRGCVGEGLVEKERKGRDSGAWFRGKKRGEQCLVLGFDQGQRAGVDFYYVDLGLGFGLGGGLWIRLWGLGLDLFCWLK